MKKQFKLTETHLKQLQDELEYLKTVREKEVAEQIKEARSFGDLSENSEYDEAKNEQGKLYSRIAEIMDILDNYVIINEDAEGTDAVGHGSKVTVIDPEDDSEEEYSIVGSQESDPRKHMISDESPFGKAMMGKRVGDEIAFHAPDGNVYRYRIEKIEK